MSTTNLQLGSMYSVRKSTKVPFEANVVDYQNQTVYFFLLSGDAHRGNFKMSIDNFNQLFSLNIQLSSRQVPLGIRTEDFAWLDSSDIK